MTTGWFTFNQTIFISNSLNAMTVHSSDFIPGITLLIHLGYSVDFAEALPERRKHLLPEAVYPLGYTELPVGTDQFFTVAVHFFHPAQNLSTGKSIFS